VDNPELDAKVEKKEKKEKREKRRGGGASISVAPSAATGVYMCWIMTACGARKRKKGGEGGGERRRPIRFHRGYYILGLRDVIASFKKEREKEGRGRGRGKTVLLSTAVVPVILVCKSHAFMKSSRSRKKEEGVRASLRFLPGKMRARSIGEKKKRKKRRKEEGKKKNNPASVHPSEELSESGVELKKRKKKGKERRAGTPPQVEDHCFSYPYPLLSALSEGKEKKKEGGKKKKKGVPLFGKLGLTHHPYHDGDPSCIFLLVRGEKKEKKASGEIFFQKKGGEKEGEEKRGRARIPTQASLYVAPLIPYISKGEKKEEGREGREELRKAAAIVTSPISQSFLNSEKGGKKKENRKI